MDSPRILYLTSSWPHDRAYGGQLRALQIGRALQQFGRPALVVVGAHDVDSSIKEKAAAEYDLRGEVKVLPAPGQGLMFRAACAVNRSFTNIHGMAAQAADEAWLMEIRKEFDLTWFFKLRTANYFRNPRWPRSVVDVDDLPSTMERSRLRDRLGFPLRLKVWLRMHELRHHEKQIGRRFDVLAVCSEQDRTELRTRSPIHIVPNGFTRPGEPPRRKLSKPPRIGFIGLFGYEPNLEGVRWFVSQCWPRIQDEIPGVRLRLVGEETDGALRPSDPAVDGLGWIEKPDQEIASWSLMVVPIRIGSGTRVKIADAFSRKCPLVSTRFGALGYDVQSGRELLLADEPREFAAACVSLIRNPEQAADLAERAHRAFLEKWTWDAIAPRVWETAEDCLRINFGR